MSEFYVGWLVGEHDADVDTLRDLGVEILKKLPDFDGAPQWACRVNEQTLKRLDPYWLKPFVWNLMPDWFLPTEFRSWLS